ELRRPLGRAHPNIVDVALDRGRFGGAARHDQLHLYVVPAKFLVHATTCVAHGFASRAMLPSSVSTPSTIVKRSGPVTVGIGEVAAAVKSIVATLARRSLRATANRFERLPAQAAPIAGPLHAKRVPVPLDRQPLQPALTPVNGSTNTVRSRSASPGLATFSI